MPDEKFLTQREFDLWREGDKEFKALALQHFEKVGVVAIVTERRIVSLETNQLNAGKLATWLSGVVATIVTAGILALSKLRWN